VSVDATVQLEATPTPADASDINFEWSSTDPTVATVSETGLVTGKNAGNTSIKVKSGSIETSVSVTVTGITIASITLKDGAGQTSGTCSYSGTAVTFTLTATVEPAVTVNLEWSSDASHVTVTPDDDGMSATVTVSGTGEAVVTAAVGDVTATYNIDVTPVLAFDNAKGYWTFEDPANYGKATRGTDLIVVGDGAIIPADGPSQTKKAITKTNMLDGFRWESHGITDQGLTDFTVLFDAWAPIDPDRRYYTLWWNGRANNYSFCIRSRDGKMTFNRAGGTFGEYTPVITSGQEPWVRAVFVYRIDPANPGKRFLRIYGDGVLLWSNDENPADVTPEMDLYAGTPIYFMTGKPDGTAANTDYNPYKLSTIAVWDRALTPEEIALLGEVSR
jgi:hypothetical protein